MASVIIKHKGIFAYEKEFDTEQEALDDAEAMTHEGRMLGHWDYDSQSKTWTCSACCITFEITA